MFFIMMTPLTLHLKWALLQMNFWIFLFLFLILDSLKVQNVCLAYPLHKSSTKQPELQINNEHLIIIIDD